MLKYWVWLSELKGLRQSDPAGAAAPFRRLRRAFSTPITDELMLTEGHDPGSGWSCWKTMISPAADKILADCQRLDIQLLTFSRRRLSRTAEKHLRPAGFALLQR